MHTIIFNPKTGQVEASKSGTGLNLDEIIPVYIEGPETENPSNWYTYAKKMVSEVVRQVKPDLDGMPEIILVHSEQALSVSSYLAPAYKKRMLILNTPLLYQLDPDVLKAIIAHELAHMEIPNAARTIKTHKLELASRTLPYLGYFSLGWTLPHLALGLISMTAIGIPAAALFAKAGIKYLTRFLNRKMEYKCDEKSLEQSKDVQTLFRYFSQSVIPTELKNEPRLQATMFKKLSMYSRQAFGSHPATIKRIRHLIKVSYKKGYILNAQKLQQALELPVSGNLSLAERAFWRKEVDAVVNYCAHLQKRQQASILSEINDVAL